MWFKNYNELLNGDIVVELNEYLIQKITKFNIDGDILQDLIQSANRNINYLKQGASERLLLRSDIAIIMEIITCLFLPIHINKNSIINITNRKRITEVKSEDLMNLIDNFKYDFNLHLDNFKGRQEEVKNLINSLLKFKYTIIQGEKEIGKSALISKSINELSMSKFGCNFSCLIIPFSFKQSKSILEMVVAIVEQCNTNLINKIDNEILDKLIKDNNIQQGTYKVLKSYLHESIKRVVKECGEIFIIIDSLELINHQADKISFLFKEIPDNCHLLFSTNESNECVNWIDLNNDSNVIKLKLILRHEIPLFSGLNDEDVENKKK